MKILIILIVSTINSGEIVSIDETVLSTMEICQEWRDELNDMGKGRYQAKCVRRIQWEV